MPTTLGINEEAIEIIRGNAPTGVAGGQAGQPGQETHDYPARQGDRFTPLAMQIEAVIAGANMPQHQRGMAQAKAQELLFWLRAGAGKG